MKIKPSKTGGIATAPTPDLAVYIQSVSKGFQTRLFLITHLQMAFGTHHLISTEQVRDGGTPYVNQTGEREEQEH